MQRVVFRGTLIGAALAFAGAALASAGVQMRTSDSFDTPLLQVELKLRTSQGETLLPGKYALKIQGAGKPGEVSINFLDPHGKLVGKTLGSIQLSDAGRQEYKYAPAGGDPHHTFASLGFGNSSTPLLRPGGGGGTVEIVVQSGKARIEARLDAAR